MVEVNRYPWLAEGAIDFLESFLTANMHVLEFGAGGSTVWLSSRVAQLTTIEHNPAWIDNVKPHVTGDWRPILQRLPYHQLCGQWGDAEFDLVLVDGKNRVDCVRSSIGLVKPGGVLMLDDASRREYASVHTEICGHWPSEAAINKGVGKRGQSSHKCNTTWWRRPL